MDENIEVVVTDQKYSEKNEKTNIDNYKFTTNANTNNINDLEMLNGITPHNGHPIDQIKYSSSFKFFATYSSEDRSIVGWTVNLDNGTIEQGKYFKYTGKHVYPEDSDNSDKIYIGDVSDDKHIL